MAMLVFGVITTFSRAINLHDTQTASKMHVAAIKPLAHHLFIYEGIDVRYRNDRNRASEL